MLCTPMTTTASIFVLQISLIFSIFLLIFEQTVKNAKHIENKGLNKCQYCFANISATKAWIFIKFYMVVNYYLLSLSSKFHEDPCINTRTGVVNARAHVLSLVRVFMTCARAFVHRSSQDSN